MKPPATMLELTRRLHQREQRRKARALQLKERKPLFTRIRRTIRVCFGF